MRPLLLCALCACVAVCAPESSGRAKDNKKKDEKVVRWYVYSDAGAENNHGEWTNKMPAEAGKMIKMSLVEKNKSYSGDTCVRVDIQWLEPFWAGCAVSCLPDYWGEKPAKAYDLRKAKKLVFHARGLKGGETIQIKAAITGDKKYGDSAQDAPASKWLKLTTKWQRFELDVSDCDLSRVVTPFCFVANKENNPQPITFFLDEIFYEW
jgi:hypothetical protein